MRSRCLRIMTASLGLLAASAVLVNCGGGSGQAHPVQPGARVNGINATFDDLPHDPGGHAVSKTTTSSNGVLTRSYEVHGADPATILKFFGDNLAAEDGTP